MLTAVVSEPFLNFHVDVPITHSLFFQQFCHKFGDRQIGELCTAVALLDCDCFCRFVGSSRHPLSLRATGSDLANPQGTAAVSCFRCALRSSAAIAASAVAVAVTVVL